MPSQPLTPTPAPFQSSQRFTPVPSISHHVVTESEKEDEDGYALNDSHNESRSGHNPAIAPSSGIPTIIASARRTSPSLLTQTQAMSTLSSHTSRGVPLVMPSSGGPPVASPSGTVRPTGVAVPIPNQTRRAVSIVAPSSSQTRPSVPISVPQRDSTLPQPPPTASYVQQTISPTSQVGHGISTVTGQPSEIAAVSQTKPPPGRKRTTTTENELPRRKRRRAAVAKPRARKKARSSTSESDGAMETEAEAEADEDEERTTEFRSKRKSKSKALKRKRLPARSLEGDTDNASSDESPRHRRIRKPHPHVDKPVAEMPQVGEPIDETTVTMNDLCNGLGQGHVSTRFLDVFQLSAVNRKRKREDRAKLIEIVRRRELGLPQEEGDEMIGQRGRGLTAADLFGAAVVHGAAAEEDESVEDKDEYATGARAARHAPQIRYDAQGNMVLDEERLEFDRQVEAEEELAAQGPVEVIVENDRDKFTNHATFSRKPGYSRWSREETELFYDVGGSLSANATHLLTSALIGTSSISYEL
jgi:transcription factor TFIIIB component B''